MLYRSRNVCKIKTLKIYSLIYAAFCCTSSLVCMCRKEEKATFFSTSTSVLCQYKTLNIQQLCILHGKGLKIQLSTLWMVSDVIRSETVRAKGNCLSPGKEDLKEKILFWRRKCFYLDGVKSSYAYSLFTKHYLSQHVATTSVTFLQCLPSLFF